MADWTRGMERTYEFWEFDPDTWGDTSLLDCVTGCTVERDADADTLGSASFEMDAWEGEKWVRAYMVTRQDGVRERWPLGSFIVQAPDRSFNGMRATVTAQGYTPLKELADDKPPVGYCADGEYVEHRVAAAFEANCHAPFVAASDETMLQEPYVADDGEDWASYLKGLLAKGKKHFEVNGRGEVMAAPDQNPRALMPFMTFDDSNSSIMQAEVNVTSNLPEVPNVVQVVYSKVAGSLMAEAVNDDPMSENSTVKLGRRKVYRETSPDLPDGAVQGDVDDLAERLLREMGAATYEVEFTHAYVHDVKLGTCVRLNYSSMGYSAVGLVVRQSIPCTPGCQVRTVARYTKEMLA